MLKLREHEHPEDLVLLHPKSEIKEQLGKNVNIRKHVLHSRARVGVQNYRNGFASTAMFSCAR